MAARVRHIRGVADRLLKAHGCVRPPVDPDTIAHALGLRVIYQSAPDDLSGFLLKDGFRNAAVIGVNSDHGTNRQRFTVAHELGHYLLHQGDALHVDRRSAGFVLRGPESTTGTDPQEIEANVFAAELLMPASFLARNLRDVNLVDLVDEEDGDSQLKRLAKAYQVSIRALTFRLANLGYIRL